MIYSVPNPDFLKEDAAIEGFSHPDRIIIGADDEQTIKVMCDMCDRSTATTTV